MAAPLWHDTLTPAELAEIPDEWREQTRGMTEPEALVYMAGDLERQKQAIEADESEINRTARIVELFQDHGRTGEESFEEVLELAAAAEQVGVPEVLAGIGMTVGDLRAGMIRVA